MSVRLDTLSNGLRVVTERMPGLESAAIGIWITAGGRHEDPQENGIAHFLEHMAFKGTSRRSALDIAEQIEDVGGYINAYTSRENTAYYARVLAGDVPLALDILSDILLDPLFAPEEIEVERGVILQEIGQVLDTPDDVIFDWLQAEAYPDQPMGRMILGTAERVQRFSRDDLLRFVARHYGPGQMILAAAGAVDHGAILRQAENLFGHLAARPAPRPAPARFGGGEVRRIKALEQAHFALAFEAPHFRDPDVHAMQILAMALGGGMSSRLFQEIRERRGLCYTIHAQASAWSDSGLVTVYAGTSGEQIETLANLMADELKRAAGDMSTPEMERARAQLKAGLLMGLESADRRAERLARMVSIWGRVPPVSETVERLDAVTLDDVRRLAGQMAGQGRAALALYGPVADAPALDALKERLVA